MSKFEILMSVMHQKDFSLAERSNIKSDLLMINQGDETLNTKLVKDGVVWRMIATTDRGLSKSRNLAIENAHGEICKLCDDDETLSEDCEELVVKAYEMFPDADVIVFNVNRINYKMKKTYYTIPYARVAPRYRAYQSAMITFRLKSIKEKGIRFNELFGSGTKLGGGEDSLFIADIRKARLKIYEYPAVISTLDYGRFGSQWFHGYDDKYFYNQGVYSEFIRPKKVFGNIIWGVYQFVKLRRERLNIFRILKWRLAGAKGFRNGQMSYEEYINKK